jgi:molecular chaperone HscB
MNLAASSRGLLRLLSPTFKYTGLAQPGSRSICVANRKHILYSRAARAQFPAPVVLWTNGIAGSASTSTVAESSNPKSSSHLPDVSNHYSIFPNTLPLGPPPKGPFDIDLASLRQEFLQLQGRFHPDKFPQEQKAKAEALSSRINEAYKALRDPLLRAQYILLNIYGIDVTSEDNSSHPVDLGILMEVMEAQESIEEADTEEQIKALKEQNQERIEDTLKLLDDAFSSGNAEAARMECIRLRYWASLAEGLNSWNGKGSDVRLVH